MSKQPDTRFRRIAEHGGTDFETACAIIDAAKICHVGISIDGIPTFNDSYRGMDGGYAAALRGLNCAKAAGMRCVALVRENASGQDLAAADAVVGRR